MTDERDRRLEPGNETENNVDNTLESLLPVPENPPAEDTEPEQVDGPIDEVLPLPGQPDSSDDDASTREELEVDTTADGVDDFVPLESPEPEKTHEEPEDETVSGNSTCLMCGKEIGGTRFCPDCGTEQVPASKAVARLAPLFMWSRPLAIRVTLSIGALLALMALLGDSGANALIITASTLPLVILIRLADQLGGQSRNNWIQICMMILIGTAAGLPIAWLSTRLVKRSWFEGGVVNFGATNFGGIAVDTAGSAPFLVWITAGILLPLVVILAIAAAPAGLRMALALPPKESTGMLLSAGVAVGYVIGSAAVFYWPLFNELPPLMSTSQWTLTILGVAVIRPLVWVYSGAILGAVIWRYLRRASLPAVAMPAAVAIGLPLLFSVVNLAAGQAGLWPTTVIGLVFAGAAIFLHNRFLKTALSNDFTLSSQPSPTTP